MKVSLTRDARTDLITIGRHIAKDNPARAVTFVAELGDAAQRLNEMPRAFPLVPRYEHHGIRFSLPSQHRPPEGRGGRQEAHGGVGR